MASNLFDGSAEVREIVQWYALSQPLVLHTESKPCPAVYSPHYVIVQEPLLFSFNRATKVTSSRSNGIVVNLPPDSLLPDADRAD